VGGLVALLGLAPAGTHDATIASAVVLRLSAATFLALAPGPCVILCVLLANASVADALMGRLRAIGPRSRLRRSASNVGEAFLWEWDMYLMYVWMRGEYGRINGGTRVLEV
jgi:hypothetical protein